MKNKLDFTNAVITENQEEGLFKVMAKSKKIKCDLIIGVFEYDESGMDNKHFREQSKMMAQILCNSINLHESQD